MGFIVHDRKLRWPNPVPYRVHPDVVFNAGAESKLNTAIAAWNMVSPLKLVHDTGKKADDFIGFKSISGGGGGGSSDSVGRVGGPQGVWADYQMTGSDITNTLLHEVGHAVGLIHEHQRPDRDAFITSNRVPAWDAPKQGNISIRTDGQAVGRYDCASLMHYRRSDDYVDPKPGRCTTLSNTTGLTDGDISALGYLAGQRYRIVGTDEWAPHWSHIVPFEHDHREYLITYARHRGEVRFGRVHNDGLAPTGILTQSVGAIPSFGDIAPVEATDLATTHDLSGTTTWGSATWDKIWDVVITFELDHERFLLVYSRGSGLVRIDRIIIDQSAMTIRTENVWEGGWTNTWRSVVSLGLESYQRDHVLVYDPGTGIVRVDKVNRGENPGFGTTNIWERKWRAGYTTVMPFRLANADWYVLVYHKGDGEGFVYHLTTTGYEKVQDIFWDNGWTHLVPYAQHSDYSYHEGDSPEPSARFLAYRSTDGAVHFDRLFEKRVEILGTDRWGVDWDVLTPFFIGEAGRFHLGNDGLIAYDYSSGRVRFDQLL
jgi:hypothetical protein